MSDYKHSLYNISLNGQGFLLWGTPKLPARTLTQAPVFGNRFAQGDRDYGDFTFWWYWVQTEWANGFKNEVSWKDDGKYYYSTNIDTYSEFGSIKVASGLVLQQDFDAPISCGSWETLTGSSYGYVGTSFGGNGKPRVYKLDGTVWTWSADITSAWMPLASRVSDVIAHKSKLWVLTVGGATNTYGVTQCDFDGANPVDYTSAILTAMGWTTWKGAYSVTSDESVLCISVMGKTAGDALEFGIVKTVDNGANWVLVEKYSYAGDISSGNIISMNLVGDDIYYLLANNRLTTLDFRKFNLTTSSDVSINFFNTSVGEPLSLFSSRRMLIILNGKLIISIPKKEVWEYDISLGTLRRLIKKDSNKETIGLEADFSVLANGPEVYFTGGVVCDGKIWWHNLMYDGTYFYNTKKNFSESSDYWNIPIFSDRMPRVFWISETDTSIIYSDGGYKETADKNFLVFNQIDTISTIDKLFYICNIIFKKLSAGQKIAIEYSIDEMATWTELGNVSYTNDGGTISNKTFYFPPNFIYKKLWVRVKLDGTASLTPTLQDISIAYYPLPAYKQRWGLNITCYDNLFLLDGKTKEAKRGEELRNLLKTYWKDKQSIEFQDVDFAENQLNGPLTVSALTITVGSTDNFPEQGIIRIEQEKIKYTGKTAFTFTGCTRGYEDTKAIAHDTNTVVSNSHKVIIVNYQEKTPVGAKTKINEFLVTLDLIEI